MRLHSVLAFTLASCSGPTAQEPRSAPSPGPEVTEARPKPTVSSPPAPSTIRPASAAAGSSLPEQALLLHEDGVENAYPRLSPDGSLLLYQSNRTGKWQLYIMDLHTREQVRVAQNEHNDNFPDWSADGEWIAFVSDRDGNEEIYRMRTDGTEVERLTSHPARDIHPYFAPDGSSLLFNSTRDRGSLDLYLLTFANGKVKRLTETDENDTCARFSPDMQHIVFLRNDVNMDDVMVLDTRTGTIVNLTDTPRIMDGWPMFSPDGQWIYYSTMATGRHSIHRVHTDGTGDRALTDAAPGEEDARAFASADGRTLVFNKRRGRAIDIFSLELPRDS